MIRFKTLRAFQRVMFLHPVCVMILGHMAWWAKQRNLPFVVTETGTTRAEDMAINRVHAVHAQFRGFDIRIHGWAEKDLKDFEIYFEEKYKEFAAIASSSGKKNLVEIHGEGSNRHIHVQISVIYAIVGINLEEKLYEKET